MSNNNDNRAIVPVDNVSGAVAMVAAFEQAKRALLRPEDIVRVQGRTFIKRSGWRLIATAFNISDEIVSREWEDAGNGRACIITVRAYTHNGREAHGIGAAEPVEKGRKLGFHDIIATAHTRAKSRAIADLVGAGEVSAEEIGTLDHVDVPVPQKPLAPAMPAHFDPVRELLESTPGDADVEFIEIIDTIADELVANSPTKYKSRAAATKAATELVEKRQVAAKMATTIEAARSILKDVA